MVQDAPFKDYQELRFDLLLADNDHGRLADEIKFGLKQSKNFRAATGRYRPYPHTACQRGDRQSRTRACGHRHCLGMLAAS